MTNAVRNVEASIVILMAGSLVSLLFARRRKLCGWISFAFVCVSSVFTGFAIVAAFTVASGEHTILSLPQLGSRFSLRIDPLSAIFLAIVAVIALLSTLYSIRYMEHYAHDNVAKFFPILLLSIASMTGVLACTDFLFFLIFWESMTLTSYFLVTFESQNEASQRAGLKYFIITHGATLCMLAAVLLLWRTSGSFAFDAARQTLSGMLTTRPVLGHAIIFLFFLGFATKAGILPMGDWLPDAHPVAPSGMSATLSGALVKLGIYGLVRVFCSFLAVSPSLKVWGIILALAGTGSLFVGTLTALRQTDTKRLMAFHTIGQIGYICLGLGVGIYCLNMYPALATIALAGAILHAVNHACFKSCLFLGAGSVLYRTGKRDMDQLGGLARFMPFTTGTTTIASLSIAGVPPLNGFTSKWLIVAGCLLVGMRFPLFLLLGLIALFISLATLASFLKVLASVFLGKTDEESGIAEVPLSMIVPQVTLASLCVLLGVFPQLVLRFIGHAIEAATAMPLAGIQATGMWSGLRLMDGSPVGFWSPLAVLAALAVLAVLCFAIQRAGQAQTRSVPVWYCGEEHSPASVRYPASSLYLPFKHALPEIYPSGKVHAPRFPAFLRRVLDLDRWLYTPTVKAVDRSADRISRTHVGIPQIYLLWIVIGAIVVTAILLWVRS
ncbi:hydrogenase, membrane subunit [Candidatus Sulfotelmatobacter kueseliae]|uniref:Hydrogenase, membrane subunit n=1 Tax=Candidatus Sulfotelmatobacter kueseliae TaxID=2042962 RepID=A0A2U3L806_9BACT|nr:hydrogenase, membrane subunit [Candidatus Sulfotelmatobacter kueseliae]